MERAYERNRADLEKFGFALCGTGRIMSGRGLDFGWLPGKAPSGACVYVALLSTGKVLKVGETSTDIRRRWRGITKVIDFHISGGSDNRKLREHEKVHGRELVEKLADSEVELWVKPAMQITLKYPGLERTYPAHRVEEVFLDDHFSPEFGQPLTERKKHKAKAASAAKTD